MGKYMCDDCDLQRKCAFYEDGYYIKDCKDFKPMTNEEFIRTCTTEQLAKFLASTFDLCGAGCHHCFLAKECLTKAKNGNCLTQEQMIVEWLKQQHTIKE